LNFFHDKIYIFVSTQLDRGKLEKLETEYYAKHGTHIWSRIFRKISMHTGLPAGNIIGRVPVSCDATELYETTPGVVYRHGAVCMSASFAQDVPNWLVSGVASATTARAGDIKNTFKTAVERFLQSKVKAAGGSLNYLYRDENYVEVLVTELRGWVLKGSNQWEKIQVSFALLGKNKNTKIRIFLDGMLASGIGNKAPPDTRFTNSMEPEHSSALTNFGKSILDEFINNKGERNE
jgi:hypothetical protein